jgi:hypothetical protein
VVHPLFVRLPINIFQQTIIHLSRLSAALNVTYFPPYYTLVTLPTDYSTPLAAICSPYSHLIPAILYPWTNSKLGGPRTQLLEMVLSNYSWRDFHRIHHHWTFMGWILRRVRHHHNPPETLQELRDALVQEWNNIPQAFIQRLIGSMRRRCQAGVATRGGHTRYWTPQTSILHDNFCLSMICSDNDVKKCCWYCLICYAPMNLNNRIFVDLFFSL